MRDKNFPIIAIVIDDLGMQLALTERAIGLDPFVTLAFLPYASDVVSQVALARSAGHEVLLHMPMEPLSGSNDPGPNALYVDLELREMLRRLRWAFDQIPHAVGLNNHMGSKFTADENAMATVIGEMKSRDLIFLDSRTTPESIATDLAHRRNLLNVRRDVFLDNDRSNGAIRSQLKLIERIAVERGSGIAIGHPYPETFNALEKWVEGARFRGFSLTTISEFTQLINERNNFVQIGD